MQYPQQQFCRATFQTMRQILSRAAGQVGEGAAVACNAAAALSDAAPWAHRGAALAAEAPDQHQHQIPRQIPLHAC